MFTACARVTCSIAGRRGRSAMVCYVLALAQRRNQTMHYTRECPPNVRIARSSPHWVSSRYSSMVPLWAHKRTGQYATTGHQSRDQYQWPPVTPPLFVFVFASGLKRTVQSDRQKPPLITAITGGGPALRCTQLIFHVWRILRMQTCKCLQSDRGCQWTDVVYARGPPAA